MKPLPARDLAEAVDALRPLAAELVGARVFLTGGTGFFGRWMLETLLAADRTLGLRAEALVLSRDPDAALARAPWLADARNVSWLEGDVRSFDLPPGRFTHVVHLASPLQGALKDENEVFLTITLGTERVIELARACEPRGVLIASSGAVYGPQPPEVELLDEDFEGETETLSGYGKSKLVAEEAAAIARDAGLPVRVARGFAFVGPGLPLDAHFAIGNFVRDGLAGGPVEVKGDGTARRSYLYAKDLAVWLWTILIRGRPGGVYNVGSEAEVSIGEVAFAVARATGTRIAVAKRALPGRPIERYIPSTERARTELGLSETVSLDEAIERTLAWHREPT